MKNRKKISPWRLRAFIPWVVGLSTFTKVAMLVGATAVATSYPVTDGWCTSAPVTSQESETTPTSYDSKTIAKGSLDQGQTEIKANGVAGTKVTTYKVVKHCGRQKSKNVASERMLNQPVTQEVYLGTRHQVTETQSIPFGKKLVPLDAPAGTSGVQTPGLAGTRLLTYQVSQDEGQPEVKTLLSNQVQANPVDEVDWYGRPRYRVGAVCWDDWQSSATGSGACSHHYGVQTWLYNW